MAQLKDDCFVFGGELMKMAEAIAILKERIVTVVGEEAVPLKEAEGRILSQDLVSPLDVPPHDNAAVGLIPSTRCKSERPAWATPWAEPK